MTACAFGSMRATSSKLANKARAGGDERLMRGAGARAGASGHARLIAMRAGDEGMMDEGVCMWTTRASARARARVVHVKRARACVVHVKGMHAKGVSLFIIRLLLLL